LRRSLAPPNKIEKDPGRPEEVASTSPSRLTEIASHTVPATTAVFECTANFVRHVWDNFKSWFVGKREQPRLETTIKQYKLEQDSTALEMIEAIGGEMKAETTLTEIKHFTDKQANGEDGSLLTNGWANIFFVRDKNGVLCIVRVIWRGDGWRVNAYPLDNPYRWSAGRQVFVRN
jgi:hypothetical protein